MGSKTGRVEVPTFWVGDGFELADGSSEVDLSDTLKSTNLGPNVHDNDTVVRWLIEWYLISSLHENSVALDHQAVPWIAGVFFTPNYTAFASEVDSFDLVGAEVGDSIYTERTQWAPVRWTDGVNNSTQWWAGSRGVQDIQSERTFRNHSTDRIWLGFQSLEPDSLPDVVDVTVSGWIRIKCLVKR